MTGWILLGALSAGVLLIAWVIYPRAAIAVGARRPSAPVISPDPPTLISVLIATREPVPVVRARLLDLLSGAWPADRLELIVAVDGDPSDYRFEDLSPAPRRIAVVPGDSPGGKASALNAGVRAATADLLVLADSHQRFEPEAIPRLLAALGSPDFAAVSGALRIGNERDPRSPLARYWRMERRLRAAEARIHSSIGVSGSIYAIRRSLWSPLPGGLILDDLWIPLRLILAGHRVGFEPGAIAEDTRTTTHDQEFVRKVRTLTGNLQIVAWMPILLLPWRNPVWIQFVCHKLLRLATPFALAGVAAAGLGVAFALAPWAGWGLLIAAGSALLAALLWPGRPGVRVRHALAWGIAMQRAVVTATWNGLRGRWDVWSDPIEGAPRQPPR
ncbi:MAG TPA: glycosyltransferase [Gemmatimonadales bacterium]|nr:glycosyltransferase [Gemmatimonadales bacterium]